MIKLNPNNKKANPSNKMGNPIVEVLDIAKYTLIKMETKQIEYRLIPTSTDFWSVFGISIELDRLQFIVKRMAWKVIKKFNIYWFKPSFKV